MSKVFEGVIIDQLSPFLGSVYSPYVSGFKKKNHDCQNVLLRFIEKCKWVIFKLGADLRYNFDKNTFLFFSEVLFFCNRWKL